MRRAHVGRSDAMVKSEQGEQGFWPSYADMMSAVALILFFLMLLAYIQNMITGNTLRRTEETLGITQQELEDSEKNLASARLQLSDTQSKLTLTQRQVDAATDELSKITTDLDAARTTLEQQQKDLETQKSELASQSQLLSDQEKLISQQEAYLLAANEEILSMHNQMQSISVLRMDILKQIRDSVAQVMGDPSKRLHQRQRQHRPGRRCVLCVGQGGHSARRLSYAGQADRRLCRHSSLTVIIPVTSTRS